MNYPPQQGGFPQVNAPLSGHCPPPQGPPYSGVQYPQGYPPQGQPYPAQNPIGYPPASSGYVPLPPQQAQAYYAAQGRHLFVQATFASGNYVMPQPPYVTYPGVADGAGNYNKKGKF
ncbi:hypothetical protein CCR75_006836 [Bremia lactucae]|uniref:Uncharacterized protein n=1 Tax=Bremia lactucae TaxID=4779 RepID=A0A976NZP9_BRELC|nr:hypothetical protein CCR75_006836 [Bremia lactucae]